MSLPSILVHSLGYDIHHLSDYKASYRYNGIYYHSVLQTNQLDSILLTK